MTFAIAAHSRLPRAEFVSAGRERRSSLASYVGWPATHCLCFLFAWWLWADTSLHTACSGCPSSFFLLQDCQGAKVLTSRSGASQAQEQEHRTAWRRACLDCQSGSGCLRVGTVGRVRGRGGLGLTRGGLDRPFPAWTCEGPGDYRRDLRAWPRPSGRLADGGQRREASCNGSEPPWAVADEAQFD